MPKTTTKRSSRKPGRDRQTAPVGRTARASSSGKKSGSKSGKHPGTFTGADDPRRGRGPAKGSPNAGRPPDQVREICRAAFEARIPLLQSIADDTTKDVNARLKAIDMLGKYGVGTTFTPVDGAGKGMTLEDLLAASFAART